MWADTNSSRSPARGERTMAPHSDSHHHQGSSLLLPKPLGVVKGHSNAGKQASGSAPFQRGRDLQSAMQHAPTIRVIHIFAPKVIKTDVANFRSTVQKLTGKGKSRSQRRAARAIANANVDGNVNTSAASASVCPENNVELASASLPPDGSFAESAGLFWDQQADKQEVLTLQRMVGDACGMTTTTTDHLVRSNSVDSATYSLDSGRSFSGDSTSPGCGASTSASMDPSFSFYPQRETPYSLGEIPAPFFSGGPGSPAVDLHYQNVPTGLPLPPVFGPPGHNVLMGLPTSHLMDHNSFGFEVDVGLPLPSLSDVACNSSSGSLFDLMPRQHCRLSVQSPYQGAYNLEPI